MGIVLFPFFEDTGPCCLIVRSPCSDVRKAVQVRRQIDVRIPHHMHGDAQVTTGDTEIGVLSVRASTFVIRHQIFSTVETQMGGGLNKIVFEDSMSWDRGLGVRLLI